MTRATKFIRQAAERFDQAGFTVTLDRSYATVSIDPEHGEGVFMQGDEADDFIDEVDALCKRFPSLNETTAAQALAEPYTELLS